MNTNDVLRKAIKTVSFYRDINDKEVFYAEFTNISGKREFVLLDSETFKSFLFVKSYRLTKGGKCLDPDRAVKKIRHILLYGKIYQDVEVFVRTSGNLTQGIEYDLQQDSQNSVKIGESGWYVSPKVRRFVIPKIALPQVTPVQTDKSPLDLLKPFVNIKGDFYTMFVIWLIQSFSLGSHYSPLILASKGCGKTTLSKIIKKLVDPCNFKVTPIPDKKDDLHVLLWNSFLCCFDNVSSISDDFSDVFCGAITGTSIAKRSLYTNGELVVSKLHNTIVINGIGVVPTRDDLAERMLLVKLEKIKQGERVTDSQLWDRFNDALPEILGAIFNTLSQAMREIKKNDVKDISRIGDAFVEMLAIAKALGICEEEFRRIFNENVEALKQVRTSSPLVEAVKEFMATVKGRKYQGKADNVLSKIRDNFSGKKSLLPNSASHFTRRIEAEHDNLLASGYRVNIDDTGAGGTEVTIIKKKK